MTGRHAASRRRTTSADPFARIPLAATRASQLDAARGAPALAPMQVGLETPFRGDDHLNAVVWADLVGAEFRQLSRAGAMSIPALARQRHLITGTTARCPLVVMTGDTRRPVQPRWTTRGDGPLSPYHRMLWSADDLLFYGWTLWRNTRGYDDDSRAALLSVERVPWERWEVSQYTGQVEIDGEPVNAADVILIPGPHEGILNFGAPSLQRMLDNLDAAANAARNPSAYLELHYTGDTPQTGEQITELRQMWAEARRGLYGGVAYTNKWLEVKEHGTHESHLLIEGRNADAVDASRMVSSPAAMADATSAGASLTYETTEGRNVQFIDYGTGIYMDAIAARLSMDDVVARGDRVAFDVTQLTVKAPEPTGAPTDD